MIIKWFGQSCLQIKSQDRIIVIDPFKNIGLRIPSLRADIVLITHDHPDHNNLSAVKPREGKEKYALFQGAGEFESEGILIKGIPAWHGGREDKKEKIFMYLMQVEGINLAHLSDLGQKTLNSNQLEALNNIDILFLPTGGTYTIGPEEAFEIANQIDPKIIVPIHYKIEGLSLDLEIVNKFLELEGSAPLPQEELRIEKENLPKEEERKIVVLKP